MNITYSLKNIKTSTLIEARLTGPVRNEDWIIFFNRINSETKNTERLYMLVDEKYYHSEINYQTAKTLLEKVSDAPIKKFVLSFSTSDPMKMQMQKLYNAMADIANVPVTISYNLSINQARNVIKNLCMSCYTKMISLVKK